MAKPKKAASSTTSTTAATKRGAAAAAAMKGKKEEAAAAAAAAAAAVTHTHTHEEEEEEEEEEEDEVFPAINDGDEEESSEEEEEEEESDVEEEDESSVLDSGDEEEEEDFEDQGSSSDESEVFEAQGEENEEEEEGIEYLGSSDEEEDEERGYEVDDSKPREWRRNNTPQQMLLRKGVPTSAKETVTGQRREALIAAEKKTGRLEVAKAMHVDDLSSDDEEGGDKNNAIGRVPLHWYEDYDHLGYNVRGEKVMKSKKADGLENAIASRDDPNYYRTVYDAVNDRTVVLSDRDLELIRRMQRGAFAHPEFEAYPPQIDVYCDEINHFAPPGPEPKRRFVPSKWEMMKVHKLVKAIKEGRLKIGSEKDKAEAEETHRKQQYYLLWKEEEDNEGEDDDETRRRKKGPRHIPAPKVPLPGHAESYNPPEEYLLSAEEEEEWADLDPEDRPLNFIPRKFSSLRAVAAYPHFIKERFERCLDLYLCPRAIRKTPTVDPDSLLPKLPNPRDLRPFPSQRALVYEGHTDRVRALAVSLDGQYMASGGEDGCVKVWEVESGYCLKTWRFTGEGGEGEGGKQKVLALAWNPNPAHHVLAVAAGNEVYLLRTHTGGKDEEDVTEALLASGLEGGASSSEAGVQWERHSSSDDGSLALRGLPGAVSMVRWHSKGDYLASIVPTGGSKAVMIHQVSKGRTQCPFKKTYGQVQTLAFHPSKPFFFVATQTHVRIYHLLKQALIKKLVSGCKWISSLDIHPSGDHVLVSSYDRRVVWFDLDLASTPYKTLKYHTKAVRAVQYHRGYPLMASGADDGSVHVFHARVYDDLMQNPLIVPVKILRGHEVVKEVGVMALAWHPSQPWLFSAGADGKVVLYQDAF